MTIAAILVPLIKRLTRRLANDAIIDKSVLSRVFVRGEEDDGEREVPPAAGSDHLLRRERRQGHQLRAGQPVQAPLSQNDYRPGEPCLS